jgi:hypothetical protein
MPSISINDVEVPYKLEASGMITKDDEDDTVFYLGCRAPQQQHLYAAVRNACVRRYEKGADPFQGDYKQFITVIL